MTTTAQPITKKDALRVQFFEPSTRTLVDWSPDLIRSAEVLAESGNLRMAADLCADIMTDDRVSGVLSTLVQGLLGLPLQFQTGVGRSKKRAVRALEAEEDFDESFPEDQLAPVLAWGIMLGVGLGQNVWGYRDNGRVVGRLKKYRERFLSYDFDRRVWRLLVNRGEQIEIAPGDGRWVLHTPGGGESPWANGAWRGISRWWLLKQYARQDWARHSEVHGGPLRVAEAANPADALSEANRKQLAFDLQDLGNETGMVLPPGYKLELVEAVARTWEMFQAQIRLADAAITIILAGQNLTTEVSGGSLAAAEVHKEIRSDKIRAADQTCSTTMHDQNLVYWAEWNFGDARVAPWPLRDTAPPEDLKAKGDSLAALGDAVTKLDKALENALDEDGKPVRVDLVAMLTTAKIPLTERLVPPTQEQPTQPQNADQKAA